MNKDIWRNASSSSLESPSVHPGSTRDSGFIQPKTIDQHPDTSADSGLTSSHQQLDVDTETISYLQPFSKPPPRLFALIIGINNYESPDIPNLLGAVYDADDMLGYLQVSLGVPISQIKNLRDSEATRAAIIDRIEAFSLNDEIKKGDPILIYYAGHGGSADTPKGWEVGSTGKIELLIPYDYSSSLEGGNYKHGIPDRAMGALLFRLADKKGDNITVILDCCHSGSGTRNLKDLTGTELVRGIDTRNVPSDLDQDMWVDFESSKGSTRGTDASAGSHVLLAACRPDESAIERKSTIEQKSRGLFTQSLLDTLRTSEINKLTYAGLLQRIPHLSSRQTPQCEGGNQNRAIFNAKATSISTVYYKIRGEGEGYVMPEVGTARTSGISLEAEFEVYQDQDSDHLLGIAVVKELSPFSTKLRAKDHKFVLEGDGVARQTSAGTQVPVLRIHVADELKALVEDIKRTDQSHRIIQMVERNQAEFGMALEDGKVVFDILDPLVLKYGLTRMPFTNLEPTIEAVSLVLRSAYHFYLHLRRTPRVENDTGKGLADVVEIEMAEMEHDGVTFNDDFEPVLSPIKTSWKGGKEFELQISDEGTVHGWKIINKSKVDLYPALFYFDISDWSITSYYQPPTARGTVDPPLKGQQFLPVGYGDSGLDPHTFFLREGQDVDVGILKLFLTREHVDLSDVAQSSPFDSIGTRYTTEAKMKVNHKLPVRHLWDTIVIPVVQRRPRKSES